jgi:glycosyltransferase involved in cell wall biosynthesis
VGLLAPNNWKAQEWNRTVDLEKPYPRLQVYPAPVLLTGRVGGYFYPPWAIAQAMTDFRPDIVQVEQEVFSLSAFEIALWARLTSKPVVLFCWENMDRHLPLLRRASRRFVMDAVQLIVAGNHEAVDVLRKWGYVGPIEVMPQMGVDRSLFNPRFRDRRNDRFCIGFLGRLVHQKGIDVLLAATRRLREQGHHFQIVLCGTGSDEEAIRHEAQKQEVADLVTWRGAVSHEQVPEEMSKFDVLVLPSRTVPEWKEQFGHVLIEAMAMGIPAIGSTCGEIPNVIGRPDLVFSEGDAEALAAILERMILEPAWRKEVEQYGITRVCQNYSHERIAERLVSLWRKILS